MSYNECRPANFFYFSMREIRYFLNTCVNIIRKNVSKMRFLSYNASFRLKTYNQFNSKTWHFSIELFMIHVCTFVSQRLKKKTHAFIFFFHWSIYCRRIQRLKAGAYENVLLQGTGKVYSWITCFFFLIYDTFRNVAEPFASKLQMSVYIYMCVHCNNYVTRFCELYWTIKYVYLLVSVINRTF